LAESKALEDEAAALLAIFSKGVPTIRKRVD
jgi:hypothetical protein